MRDIKNINERIKAFRINKGYSQQYVSHALGISQGYLSEIEAGTKTPSTRLLLSIIGRWELRSDWLFEGKGEMFLPKVSEEPAQYGTGICSEEIKELWQKLEYIFEHGKDEDITTLFGITERIMSRIGREGGGEANEGSDREPERFPGSEKAAGKVQKPA